MIEARSVFICRREIGGGVRYNPHADGKDWKHQKSGGEASMVKGTSRRVIVVESPDPEFFEQAIFIVRNDVYERQGVTAQQVLSEACRIARGYAATAAKPLWKKIPWWGWTLCAAVGLLFLILAC